MSGESVRVRRAEPGDAPDVLALWERERSGHASAADRAEDVERLIADSPAALLVAFGDEAAGGFWDSVGYPRDREIGRRVRNL